MCYCRLIVSQTTQVEMFPTSLTEQCDISITIKKWRTSSQCTNGAAQTIPGQTHTVNTSEEIWILVVATRPGARGLLGQLQFRLKSSSGQLNIECFEPNTNSSTSTGSLSTKTLTFTITTSPKTTAVTTTTERLTSTPPHTTETLRPTAITPQGQTTSVSTGLTAGPGTTKATFTTTQISMKGCQSRNNDFPGGIFAAGVATGAVLVVIAGALYVVTSRRWWRSRHEKSDDIPVSEVHPTYSGLKPRTQEPSNTYDIIDQNPSKGTANPYINVT
ncbi:uncharacterized protein LOC124140052 [Haliotis rufescens]|uniref:uncharacterized protein LOC124140052 n=1 Tax=Haliotis rufescens TaxID=6454 RepID=UPI00201ED7AC|nr:uncharacterized protein LOC124140052 [Haliotis rufescens]